MEEKKTNPLSVAHKAYPPPDQDPEQEKRDAAVEELRKRVGGVANEIDKVYVTEGLQDEKVQQMLDFATEITCKHPEWKTHKVARKTAEYFHLKKRNT